MIGERFQTSELAQPQAVGELRRRVAEYARLVGATEVVIDAVKLAVSEALTNVVVRAYVDHGPGPMIVEPSIDGHGHLVVLVCDEGVGMVPRTDSPGMGVGISLMAQMADDVSVANRHDAPGAIVSLCFALDDSRSPTRNDSFLSNGSPTDDRSSPVSTCDDRGD